MAAVDGRLLNSRVSWSQWPCSYQSEVHENQLARPSLRTVWETQMYSFIYLFLESH